jgi:TusA-related sulfurtransferase
LGAAHGLAEPPVHAVRSAYACGERAKPLTVLATGPVATIDLPYYCHHFGIELVSTTRQADVLIFEIRKPARPVPLAPNRPIG